jgi:hypothetical protein
VGVPAQAPSAPAPEEDFGDIDIEPSAGAPPPAAAAPPAFDDLSVDVDAEQSPAAPSPAPIQLPLEQETDKVGHRPEAAPGAPRDGGEALLRDALSKASREVIERVVWEVVPQLAETIIRENLDRLVKQRQG